MFKINTSIPTSNRMKYTSNFEAIVLGAIEESEELVNVMVFVNNRETSIFKVVGNTTYIQIIVKSLYNV